MNNGAILILNYNYEPLNVCNLRRAMVMILGGRAEILENGRGMVHSVGRAWPIPSVIRLNYLIRRPLPRVRLCRKEVFRRDNYTCQYCGRNSGERMTIDHVIPKSLGGRTVWENVVSACRTCNLKKGNKTLEEARMCLLRRPAKPVSVYYLGVLAHASRRYECWRKYLPMESDGYALIGAH